MHMHLYYVCFVYIYICIYTYISFINKPSLDMFYELLEITLYPQRFEAYGLGTADLWA